LSVYKPTPIGQNPRLPSLQRPKKRKEKTMRVTLLVLAGVALCAASAAAQSADEIVGKYLQAAGGMEKVQAIHSLRRVGKYVGGGGFEAAIVQENKRDHRVREEFVLQDLTGINAYDGTTGWKIEPWNGKKDAEALSEEESKSILEDSDFDGPLVDYRKKGNKVEYVGHDEVEGTDAHKLKVTLPNGTVFHYYLDTDSYMPIKIDTRRMIRGAEREYETIVGDYKQVAGWYLPYSFESNVKGSSDKSKIMYDTIEANVPIDDARFQKPATKGSAGSAAKAQGVRR
jgi:hypothetical protein